MLRYLACLAGVLAVLVTTARTEAQVPTGSPPAGVPLSALIGQDPVAVRARLADVAADWPAPPAFQIASPQGLLTFLTLHELMMDPVLAQRLAVFRTAGDPPPAGPYLECRGFLTRDGGSPEPNESIVLIFRDGRLESAAQTTPVTIPPLPRGANFNASIALARRPVTSPYVAHFGELPLEDGLGFLSRWRRTALAPGDRLSATCSPPPPPRRIAPSPRHGLDAGDMQGLALLPFAVTLPFKNHQRVAARHEGAALLATLHVGAPLGAAPRVFALTHRGVRAYTAAQGDYAVLSIDMGGYPGRNLSNFNDVALVGVRGGRVEWMSPPVSDGPHAPLLCLDAQGVPNAPRPGCSGWGQFSP